MPAKWVPGTCLFFFWRTWDLSAAAAADDDDYYYDDDDDDDAEFLAAEVSEVIHAVGPIYWESEGRGNVQGPEQRLDHGKSQNLSEL